MTLHVNKKVGDKMNKKGFMMAEVIVVSAIVLVAITGLYTSYAKVYIAYRNRATYYDVNTLYRLGFYRDLLISNVNETSGEKLITQYLKNTTKVTKINTAPFKSMLNVSQDTIYMVKLGSNNSNLISSNFSGIKPTFTEYIDFLKTSKPAKKSANGALTANYILIMEHCLEKDKSSEVDVDSCYYAYLDIYEEK